MKAQGSRQGARRVKASLGSVRELYLEDLSNLRSQGLEAVFGSPLGEAVAALPLAVYREDLKGTVGAFQAP